MTPEDLVELELIKRVKYRYLRCLDQKLWDDLDEVLTEDCVATYSGGKYRYEGRDAIVDFLRRNMGSEAMHSSHRVHQPEIDLTSPTTAVGVWALEDVVVMTDWDLTVQGAAFYEDEYRKEDGRWRIAATGYKRTYEEVVPRASIDGIQLTASWWTTGGQSSLDVQ
ncbi:MAG: nuclear transport factor 2 family protein [Acidimicrobiales bacterium]